MSIAFDQLVPVVHGTTGTVTTGSFTPAANDFVAGIGADFNSATATLTQTGSVMTLVKDTTVGNFGDPYGDTWSLWTAANVAASANTIALSGGAGTDSMRQMALCYSGVASYSNMATPVVRNGPGVGAGAIVGTAVTVPVGSSLIIFITEVNDGSATAITANNGSPTTDATGTNLAGGTSYWAAFRYAGTGSSFTPNFTCADGVTGSYLVLQFVLAPSTSTVKFRKTLSSIGGRIGARQLQS